MFPVRTAQFVPTANPNPAPQNLDPQAVQGGFSAPPQNPRPMPAVPGSGMGWNPQQRQPMQMQAGPNGNPGMMQPFSFGAPPMSMMQHFLGGGNGPMSIQYGVPSPPMGMPPQAAPHPMGMQPQAPMAPQAPQQSMLSSNPPTMHHPQGAAQQFRQQNPGQGIYGASGVHGKAWGTPNQGFSL